MDMTPSEQEAVRIVLRVCVSLSIFGDFVIINGCFRKKLSSWTTYHRILVIMSFADIFSSLWYGVGDASVPAPHGSGSQALCTAQGFFEQFLLCVPLLNAMLAANYLVVLKYQWSHEKVRRYEPIAYIAIFTVCLILAIIPLPLQMYNYAFMWCFIAESPPGCSLPGSTVPCVRGHGAPEYQFYLCYIPLWLSVLFSAVAMYLVYTVVRDQDRKINKLVASQMKRFENTKRLVKQALLYVTAFFITWFFVTVMRLYNAATGNFSFPLAVLSVTFMPAQGFFNMLCFMYPRIVKLQLMGGCSLRQKFYFVFGFIDASQVSRVRETSIDLDTHVPYGKGKEGPYEEKPACETVWSQ
eukprot:CAMPEP_0203765596 /NCGR_PEP_ID=MMETSP0098-20131031/18497_1 /ASSEMBLY_ACC=CAM_ASM_000208 /TAXON_ID=96639 /ORGANISM=" , Strain NY0313808BC1" /LENGTH=353 /DNA_ID=CAMNT_0050661861 /DNA_START=429 /DNA_END=1490 /DNA_ORIENTATION=+